MSVWLTTILEIVKLTVPALVVFMTVYFLMKQYLENQRQIKLLDIRQGQQEKTLPLRLQAYERLSLFCDRIAIPNLLLRWKKPGMTTAELKFSLLMAIQQEYEHNITQQVYVSDQLWQIVKIARDDAVNFISLVADSVDPKAKAEDFSEALIQYVSTREMGVDKALIAIKREAGILL
ncbi:MAG: hypothetical protein DHS20C18_22120 [Saprospiraceae bacterium]|nr:MAG: hypothetical protein DHS20C18_22120 [Saprospiraceae bacterium]